MVLDLWLGLWAFTFKLCLIAGITSLLGFPNLSTAGRAGPPEILHHHLQGHSLLSQVQQLYLAMLCLVVLAQASGSAFKLDWA